MDTLEDQLVLKFDNTYKCKSIKVAGSKVIDRSEVYNLNVRCNGLDHNVIDCKSPYLKIHLLDVKGLEFSNVKSIIESSSQIPYFIPILSKRHFKYNIESRFVGLTLKSIFKSYPIKSNFIIHECKKNLKINLDVLKNNIFRHKKVILFATGKDCLIEELWKEQINIQLFNKIKQLGLHASTSVNYSIMIGECPFSHCLNLKKSLITFESIQEIGLQCIPHIYWINIPQVRRWIAWLKNNPNIKLVNINCQLCKEKVYLNILSDGMGLLLKELPYLRILLQGPKKKLLKAIRNFSNSIHIASSMPSDYAVNHRILNISNETFSRVESKNQTIDTLIGINNNNYIRYLEENFYYRKL